MGLSDRVAAAWSALRSDPALSFDDWVSYFNFNSNTYPVTNFTQTMPGQREEDIDGTYGGFITGAYKRNGVIFACMMVRALLFSEARFSFQAMVKGRPGELFGTQDLRMLERPSPGQTTGELLSRMIQDADLAGNWYGVRRAGNRIKRLRPDWVTILLGSESDPAVDARDIDAEVVAYVYHPGGRYSGIEPEILFPNQVAHFAPIPDPQASFRGMSWLTPIVREIMGDSAATSHKLRFFENGATPNMVVSLDKDIGLQAFKEFVAEFKKSEPKGFDVYKTLYLGAGATSTVVGANLQQIDFKVTQGAGETRIAAAAGVPPVIVGLSEGLQGSSLNAGNYQMARRRFADGTMRPLWRMAAGALETIITMPGDGARLWYDDRDIPFLQEDVKDAAEIQQINAAAMVSLAAGGWEPDAVVDAIMAGDLARLKGKHGGLFSVQLQPPMPEGPAPVVKEVPQLTSGEDNGRSVEAVVTVAEAAIRALDRRFEPLAIEDGAIRVENTFNLPEQPAPVTNVTMPEQAAPVVNIAEGAVRAEFSQPEITVNVPEQPAPVVNIAEGAIRATVEAPPPAEVTVNLPEQEAPVVNAPISVNLSEPKPTRKTVKRDSAGRITEVAEISEGKMRSRKVVKRDKDGRITEINEE